MNFVKKYERIKEKKDSILCLGLDPALAGMKEGAKAKTKDAGELAACCISLVEKTGEHCCAAKANLQFLLPLSLAHYRKINRAIHKQKMLSILDLKLGDIGSSNAASVYWIKEAGFDALTFSPFAGNVREAIEAAHKKELGVFTLTLMSNPEAKYFMKGQVEGKIAYQWIADQVKQAGGDGVVVGATKEGSEMQEIRGMLGEECIFLVPGVGAQGGDEEAVLKNSGKNVLINVGRSILQAPDPAQAAREYKERFNSLRVR